VDALIAYNLKCTSTSAFLCYKGFVERRILHLGVQSSDVTAALSFSLLGSKSVSCLQGMNLEFQPFFPGFFQLVQTL